MLTTVALVLPISVSSTPASIAAGNSLLAAKHRPSLATTINRYLKRYAARDRLRGTVLVARRGKIILKAGYGFADSQHHIRKTPRTTFGIVGLLDPLTAASIMQLQEEGKLSLQDEIRQYIPGCPVAWAHVTIADLLTHTAGAFDPYTEDPSWTGSGSATVAQILEDSQSHPVHFNAGTGYRYSLFDYLLLALAIKAASGEPFEQYVQRNVFAPANMASSGIPEPGAATPTLALPYEGNAVATESIDLSRLSPANAMYSTVVDLYRFDRALISAKLVAASSRDAMLSSHVTIHPGLGAGYGWFIRRIRHHRLAERSATAAGLTDVNVVIPDSGIAIIMLENQSQFNPAPIVTRIERSLLTKH